jgi:hypothetical protein
MWSRLEEAQGSFPAQHLARLLDNTRVILYKDSMSTNSKAWRMVLTAIYLLSYYRTRAARAVQPSDDID